MGASIHIKQNETTFCVWMQHIYGDKPLTKKARCRIQCQAYNLCCKYKYIYIHECSHACSIYTRVCIEARASGRIQGKLAAGGGRTDTTEMGPPLPGPAFYILYIQKLKSTV